MKRGAESAKVFSRDMKKIGAQATQVGAALTKTLTLPLVGIGAAAFASAKKLDEGMDVIRASTGATGSSLEALGVSFRKVFKNVPADVGTVSQAIATLSQRTGLTGPALETLTTQMINLARVSGSQVGPVIAAATRAFGDWSIVTDQQSQKLDFLFKVSQATGIGVTRLTELVVQFGAPMRALGFSFEEAAMLMGKWEKEGVNLETVLSGLRFALGNFAKAGREPAEALKEVQAAILGAKNETDATAIAFANFGKRAAVDMSRAIIEGRFNIDELAATLKTSQDTINSAAKDTESFGEKWTIVRNQITAAIEPIGVQLLGAFEALMPQIIRLAEFVATMGDKFAALPGPVRLVSLGLVAVAAVAGPLIWTFGQLAIAAGSVAGAFTAHGIATRALTANLITLRATAASVGAAMVTFATVTTAGLGLLAIGITNLAEKWKTLRLREAEAAAKQDTINAAIKRGADATISYTDAIKFNDEWLKKRTGSLVAAANEQQRTTGSTQALKDKFDALNETLKAADAEIAQLSNTAKSSLTKALQSGAFSMEELEQATGLSSVALKIFADRVRDSNKPLKDNTEALRQATQAAAEYREFWNFLGIRRMEDEAQWLALLAQEAGMVADLGKTWSTVGATQLEVFNELLTKAGSGGWLQGMSLEPAIQQTKDWRDSLHEVVGVLSIVGDKWSTVAQGILRQSDAIVALWQGGNKTAAIGQAIGLAGQFIPTDTTKGKVAKGATQGAAIGSVFGPVGLAVGAGVGALIGWMKSQGAHKQVNRMRDAFVEMAGGLHNLNVRAKAAGLSLAAMLNAKTPEQYEKAIQELTAGIEQHAAKAAKAVETLTSGFNSMAVALQGDRKAVEALGRQALNTFGLLIAQGATWSEAITAIAPGLQALKKSYEELGLEIQDSALQTLLMQSTILDANPALIQGIDALAGQFEALAILGMLNAETFADMELIGMRMYTRLQDQVARVGGTTKDALLPMQMFLHEAANRAKELGIPLDDNTAMLIDQSKELGMWKEAGKTANDLMLDGLSRIVDKLDEFMRKLLGLPDRVETTVHTNYTTSGDSNAPEQPAYPSRGGFVTAHGVNYFRLGGMVPRGTDTIPAMLTPGEMVLNGPQQEAIRRGLAMSSHEAGGGTLVVKVMVDDREIGESIIRNFYETARRMGVA